jgi:sorbitol-specific phosphotransferase system component IIC
MLAMEALRGAEVIASNSKPLYYMEFINQIHSSANLHPGKNHSTLWIWDCVGPKPGLDVSGEQKNLLPLPEN